MQRNKNNDEAAKGFDTKFVVATALKLLLISAVTALLLSGVNALTKDTIAENDAKEKSAAIAAIFPDDIIHIGADEYDMSAVTHCTKYSCIERICRILSKHDILRFGNIKKLCNQILCVHYCAHGFHTFFVTASARV